MKYTLEEHEAWRQNQLEESRKLPRTLKFSGFSMDYYCSWCSDLPEECDCLTHKPCTFLINKNCES